MIKNVTTLLAWRSIWSQGKEKNISSMIKICFLGIFIGTTALMLSLIITDGFEKKIHEKIQGINADLIMHASGNKLAYEQLKQALLNHYPHSIAGVSASSTKQIIAQRNEDYIVMLLKGIDPASEPTATQLPQKIIAPTLNRELTDLLHDNHILIGHKYATENGYELGDTMTLMLPEPRKKNNISLKKIEVVISGFFSVGLEEFDQGVIFCSLDFLNETFDEEGADQLTIKLNNEETILKKYIPHKPRYVPTWCYLSYKRIKRKLFSFITNQTLQDQLAKKIKKKFPECQTIAWYELYPALVSSLKLEKLAMFLVLALITLVASMNMISLLFMQIQQKRRDVAILKAMGMPSGEIRIIFLKIGMFIIVLASLTAIIFSALIGYVLERYPYIKLPDVYYVSHLPASMDFTLFVVVFIATLIIGFCATWFPASQVKKINCAHVLREE